MDHIKDKRLINFGGNINSVLKISLLDVSEIDDGQIDYLTHKYLQHRFDLLGSGWVLNSYNSASAGLNGNVYRSTNYKIDNANDLSLYLNHFLPSKYVSKSRKLLSLLSESYSPIDWHKDFKSGYRWNSKKWYKHIRYGEFPGADVKVPWELTRFNHLPQLAVFGLKRKNLQEIISIEFRNQVIDFYAMNPVRFGVNWKCTMDVAIRIANLVIAYDIINNYKINKDLNTEFKNLFYALVHEHTLHILDNLEIKRGRSQNHYLANIVGLLFASGYLTDSPESYQIRAFCMQELISEIDKQFYTDGGNFESSSSYHRLSGEMAVLGITFAARLFISNREQINNYELKRWKFKPRLKPRHQQAWISNENLLLSNELKSKLFGIGFFTQCITKQNCEVAQFGDNDSGRFLKLSPNGRFLSNREASRNYMNLASYCDFVKKNYQEEESDLFWDENIMNHQNFISMWSAILPINERYAFINFPLEYSFIKSLLGNNVLYLTHSEIYLQESTESINDNDVNRTNELKYFNEKFLKAPHGDSICKNLELYEFHDSGIYVFKSARMTLIINVSPLGQNGNGGHSHNDKLSFELNIDGTDIILDPGSFLYTPDPKARNQFRSTYCHSVPQYENLEQNVLKTLFSLSQKAIINVLSVKKNKFVASMTLENIYHIREFIIFDDGIYIKDYSNQRFYQFFNNGNPYSNGYGKLYNNYINKR